VGQNIGSNQMKFFPPDGDLFMSNPEFFTLKGSGMLYMKKITEK